MGFERIALMGIDTLFCGVSIKYAFNLLADYSSTKADALRDILRTELAKTPELTDKMYYAADTLAESVARPSLYLAMVAGAFSIFLAGHLVHTVMKKDPSEKLRNELEQYVKHYSKPL